jgi:hypothetical protein
VDCRGIGDRNGESGTRSLATSIGFSEGGDREWHLSLTVMQQGKTTPSRELLFCCRPSNSNGNSKKKTHCLNDYDVFLTPTCLLATSINQRQDNRPL